jgi:hypothetical protein
MIKLWTAGAAPMMVMMNYLSRKKMLCILYGLVPGGARVVVIWGEMGARGG